MPPKEENDKATKRIDSAYAGSTYGLKNAEEEGTVSDGNDSKSDDLQSKENTGHTNSVKGKPSDQKNGKITTGIFALFKKKGPLAGIGISVFGFGFVAISLLGPSLALNHIKELFTDKFDHAAPARIIRNNKLVYSKFKDTRNAFEESKSGSCNIKCKFGSVNDNMIRNLKANGFEVETTSGKGILSNRFTIVSLKFPGENGPKVTNGEEFTKLLKDPAHASVFEKAFNSRTSYFLSSKFGSMLSTKFGLNKMSKLTSDVKEGVADKVAAAKEKVRESMRKALGISSDGTSTIDKKLVSNIEDSVSKSETIKTDFSKLSSGAGKVNKAVGPLSLSCSAYNIARGISFAVKHRRIIAFSTYAMLFLVAADQIKAGDADPDVISALGDQLTQQDENGLTATDSVGYKAAAYNEISNLSEKDKEYSASLSSASFGVLATALSIPSRFMMFDKIGYKGVSGICGAAGSSLVDIGLTCSPEIIAAIASGGLSAIVSAGVCAATVVTIGYVVGKALGSIINSVIKSVSDNDLPNLSDETVGTAVGNSIYTGTAQILGGAAASSGLKAANKEEIEEYAINTAEIRQQTENIAIYNAQQNPFDIYDKYSFLGQIAQTINLSGITNSSTASYLTNNILAVIPNAFSSINTSILAEENDSSKIYDGTCEDPSLEALGIDADQLCNPAYVMSRDELDVDIFEAAQYMIDEKYIDEMTGEALPDSDYKLYLDNCANRSEPLGETSSPIEDGNYAWKIGTECVVDSEIMTHFRAYTMDKLNNDVMEGNSTAVAENPEDNILTLSDYLDIIDEITQEYSEIESFTNIESAQLNPTETKITDNKITHNINYLSGLVVPVFSPYKKSILETQKVII